MTEGDTARVVFLTLLGLGIVYALLHVLTAWTTASTPPVECQLLGGHWDLWNGWRCG